MDAQTRAAELLSSGYLEVDQAGELQVGQRVRHAGQQYAEARRFGTAVIERIFQRAPDIELIVKRDKPEWGPDDTHGYWADYHTVAVRDWSAA